MKENHFKQANRKVGKIDKQAFQQIINTNGQEMWENPTLFSNKRNTN